MSFRSRTWRSSVNTKQRSPLPLRWARGIVTETGSGERNRVGCRHGPAQLSPPSVPARDHPARDLALSPLHPELPRCRGTAGRARARHLLRNGAALGAEIRSRDRATAAPAASSAEQSMASGRCVTNTLLKEEVWCCTRDEGRPLDAGG